MQGPPGPVNLVYRKGTNPSIAAGATGGFAVGCPESAPNVVGGGLLSDSLTGDLRLVRSIPADGGDPDGIPDDNWDVIVYNAGASPQSLTVYAICTTASSVAQAPDEL